MATAESLETRSGAEILARMERLPISWWHVKARIIVGIVHKQIPDYTSLERMVANRKGKMYLDFLQNRPGATIAGPYSLRPKVGATVSMPLAWDEVKPGLTMKDFTIFNSIDRLKETGDLFKGVLDKGIDLEKVIKKAQSTF